MNEAYLGATIAVGDKTAQTTRLQTIEASINEANDRITTITRYIMQVNEQITGFCGASPEPSSEQRGVQPQAGAVGDIELAVERLHRAITDLDQIKVHLSVAGIVA
jgi:hypothetical protein